jgi:phosphoglycolate phosphatase
MILDGATIAFDLDGTLVDTAPDLIAVLNVMLEEAGHPAVPFASARELIGGGAKVLLEHGFERAGAEFPHAQGRELVERFVELYRVRMDRESRPFPGVAAALDRLTDAGARLVVATNKRTDLSVDLLGRLSLVDRFAFVAGPQSVSRRKPDPAHLIQAVEFGGGDPTRMLMVGDSINDVLPAKAAGCPVVAVSFGYTEIPVRELGADAVIDRYDELFAVIERLLA